MHVIDLGDDVKFEVKLKGETYHLREPSVAELRVFKDASDDASVDALSDLLAKLGMPQEVVQSLGVSKAKALIEGLLDLVNKKK